VGMLVGAAFALYPTVLPASTDPSYSLTIYNSPAGPRGLAVGFAWWILGMVLVIGYFRLVYRTFGGKVSLEDGGYEAGKYSACSIQSAIFSPGTTNVDAHE
jgi:cytochrome bd ubiquinol oxidase subunit II